MAPISKNYSRRYYAGVIESRNTCHLVRLYIYRSNLLECADLIHRMLTVDPKNRAKMPEILEHVWVNGSRYASLILPNTLIM